MAKTKATPAQDNKSFVVVAVALAASAGIDNTALSCLVAPTDSATYRVSCLVMQFPLRRQNGTGRLSY